MPEKTINSDTRHALTGVASVLYKMIMPSTIDIFSAAGEQFARDVKKLSEVNQKMNSIRQQFLEYKDLDAQAKELDERVRSQIGVFGDILPDKDIENLPFEVGITTTVEQEKKTTPLWKMLREVIRQVTEIRVAELERILTHFNHKMTRQAIESALKTHPDTFRVTRRGRQVFVSLK